jgi:hypothetical protein
VCTCVYVCVYVCMCVLLCGKYILGNFTGSSGTSFAEETKQKREKQTSENERIEGIGAPEFGAIEGSNEGIGDYKLYLGCNRGVEHVHIISRILGARIKSTEDIHTILNVQ